MTGRSDMPTPALEDLMGGYFHQDWDTYGETHMAVVDQFILDDPELAAALPAEILHVLSETPDDELETLLESMGCEVYPQPRELGYRRWLSAIADRARGQS